MREGVQKVFVRPSCVAAKQLNAPQQRIPGAVQASAFGAQRLTPDKHLHAKFSGKRRRLTPFIAPDFVAERIEKMKASIRAKVEHPFRVLKRQFGFTKVRYRELAKNTAQIVTLFALSNLWMARRQLMGAQG